MKNKSIIGAAHLKALTDGTKAAIKADSTVKDTLMAITAELGIFERLKDPSTGEFPVVVEKDVTVNLEGTPWVNFMPRQSTTTTATKATPAVTTKDATNAPCVVSEYFKVPKGSEHFDWLTTVRHEMIQAIHAGGKALDVASREIKAAWRSMGVDLVLQANATAPATGLASITDATTRTMMEGILLQIRNIAGTGSKIKVAAKLARLITVELMEQSKAAGEK